MSGILWRVRLPAFHLTGGKAADGQAFDMFIEVPEAPIDHKGYDNDACRADLEARRSESRSSIWAQRPRPSP